MALLEVRNLRKKFGGLLAIQALNFEIGEGEIVGLIGPNGAGKSTLFNLVCGIHRPTGGRVTFDGNDITNLSADKVAAKGLSRTFQELTVFGDFTVLDSVLIGFHLQAKNSYFGSIVGSPSIRSETISLRQQAIEVLRFMSLDKYSTELVKNLSYGHQKALGVAIAIASRPRLLLLDEPVAGMSSAEKIVMMEHIKRIKERGCSILLVEHAMKVVMELCERIIVVNFGEKIAEGPPSEILNNERVIEAYLGVKEDVDFS